MHGRTWILTPATAFWCLWLNHFLWPRSSLSLPSLQLDMWRMAILFTLLWLVMTFSSLSQHFAAHAQGSGRLQMPFPHILDDVLSSAYSDECHMLPNPLNGCRNPSFQPSPPPCRHPTRRRLHNWMTQLTGERCSINVIRGSSGTSWSRRPWAAQQL